MQPLLKRYDKLLDRIKGELYYFLWDIYEKKLLTDDDIDELARIIVHAVDQVIKRD